MCLRNLFQRRGRTWLCVLGVALCIMLIIAIGGTTNHYINAVKEMNVFYRGNVVVVPKGSIFVQAISVGGFIQESVLENLRTVEETRTATPMLFILGFPIDEAVIQVVPSNITVGIPDGNWSVLTGSLALKPGGSWPSTSLEKREAVIGAYLSLKYDLSIGSEIEIHNHKLKVTGILDTGPSSSFLGGTILMTLDIAQEVFQYQHLISMIVVEPEEGVTEKDLSDRIEAEVPGVRGLTGNERNDVIAPIFRDLELWSLGIRSVISFITMILVMIVSMMNVFERRKELATLDALGIPLRSIVRMVVTETGFIGLFGWILGIPLGIIATLLISYIYTLGPISMIISGAFNLVPPVMMLEILLSTLALSGVAGLLSTLTFTRMNIVDLMRSE
jgi:putative ABC transport system permease protein